MPESGPRWQNIAELLPDDTRVRIKTPRFVPEPDSSLEFHAARLLLLLYHAGGSRNASISGRTKLAKMDFFIRYPAYLIKAARIKKVTTGLRSLGRPESKMIRFRYGPWDPKYYDILAYLVAKSFVVIYPSKSKGDIFELTSKGIIAAKELVGPEFDSIIDRCVLVKELFGNENGNAIKNFVYTYFPEIIGRPLGEEIDS
jgi:hypothetical protein